MVTHRLLQIWLEHLRFASLFSVEFSYRTFIHPSICSPKKSLCCFFFKESLSVCGVGGRYVLHKKHCVSQFIVIYKSDHKEYAFF